MHELGGVALVFESVIEEGVTHANHALLATIELVSELFEPHPVVGVASLRDLVLQELIHHIDVVDDVQDEGLHLDEQQVVTPMLKLSIALELSLKVTLVVLKFALLDCLNTVSAKVEHFGEAAYLRGHVSDVKTLVA